MVIVGTLKDEELIARIQANNDQDAFRELYDRYEGERKKRAGVASSKYKFNTLTEWESEVDEIFLEATKKFSSTRGMPFLTYLSWKLKQRVTDRVRLYLLRQKETQMYELTKKIADAVPAPNSSADEPRDERGCDLYQFIAKQNALFAKAIKLRLAGFDDLEIGKRLGYTGTKYAIGMRVNRLFEKIKTVTSAYYTTV